MRLRLGDRLGHAGLGGAIGAEDDPQDVKSLVGVDKRFRSARH